MLGLIYPRSYAEVFEPLTDFEVLDAVNDFEAQLEYLQSTNKSVWLDLRATTDGIARKMFEKATSKIDILTVFPPHNSNEPEENIRIAVRWRDILQDQDLIAIWSGEKRHIKMLADTCELVALPNWRPRAVYMNRDHIDTYHLYGFCNLDEIRRYPVETLTTSCPITAAMQGADLALRERRPKFLCELKHDMKMSESQIELAVKNIAHIRDAMGDA